MAPPATAVRLRGMKRPLLCVSLAAPVLALACTEPAQNDDAESMGTQAGDGDGDDGDGDGDTPGDGDGDGPSGNDSCDYTSVFTQTPECRDYIGAAWTEAEVEADCAGVSGTVNDGIPCATEGVLGRCVFDAGTDWEQQTVIYGADASACDLSATGCETFGGGTWEPEPLCEGSDGGGGGNVFIQPYRECVAPLDGEPPGQSEGGEVCTWQMIAASTEEGRKYKDYGDCEAVYTQRPYYAAPPNPAPAEPDPRLEDPDYVAELTWVTEQIEASACICCHSEEIAPVGPSNWYIEAPNNWINSFDDTGLAFGAGWVTSVALGAYDPADNNGFDRINSGFPTTDPERMVAFFINELAHRGKTEADFVDTPPFGGPLWDQLVFEPSECESGEGVKPDGSVVWTGGLARYVYVLDAGSQSPTIPPNLDLPAGTRWRVDVPWEDGEPVGSGELSYGQLPAGLSQRFPIDGAPQGLVPGGQYYLYVSKDVGIPITRCLFTY